MKNTLNDLNNYLFESLERLQDDELTDEEMQKEITRSQSVVNVAQTIIKNAEVSLNALKHLSEYGHDIVIPPLLGMKIE